MKEEILKAIFKVKKPFGPRFEEKKAKNISKIRQMARNAHFRNIAGNVIAYIDTSFFKNGSEGFLITETGFYCVSKKENASFLFSNIDYTAPSPKGKLIINLMDGSTREVQCGGNKFYIANVIDNIIDAIDEAASKPTKEIPKAKVPLDEEPDDTDLFFIEEIADEMAKSLEHVKSAPLKDELALNVFPELEEAAAKGDINAIRRLGEIYLNGYGVEKDSYTAYLWYLKGKDLRDPVSITALGEIYLDGTRKFPEDPYMALKMFEEAAEMGYSRAELRYEAIKDDEDLYF